MIDETLLKRITVNPEILVANRCRLLADWLRKQGHDVVESRELGPDPITLRYDFKIEPAPDLIRSRFAASEKRVEQSRDRVTAG